jgi:hypothetical protein
MNPAYFLKRICQYAFAIGQIRSIIHYDFDLEETRRRIQKVLNELEELLENETDKKIG